MFSCDAIALCQPSGQRIYAKSGLIENLVTVTRPVTASEFADREVVACVISIPLWQSSVGSSRGSMRGAHVNRLQVRVNRAMV